MQDMKKNQMIRIKTLPEISVSTTTVVMFKQAKQTDERFTGRKTFNPDENIAKEGEECKKGDVILEKGSMINPGTVAVLATFGYSEVEVFKKPIVGVLSTGSELLDVDEELVRGKIRNSNTPMILAQLKRAG